MSDQPVHVLLTMQVDDSAELGEYFARVTPPMTDAGIELLTALRHEATEPTMALLDGVSFEL